MSQENVEIVRRGLGAPGKRLSAALLVALAAATIVVAGA